MYKLKPYQKKAVIWIKRYGYQMFLCDEMGLGKTATALKGIEDWLEDGRYLVICPASLKYNWCREIKLWLGLDVEPDNMTDFSIAVTNYERLGKYYDEIMGQGFIGVIFDESHYLKNRDSQRTQSAIKISRFIPYVMLLSGTPMLAGPIDLASQLDVLRLLPLFGGYDGFAKRYTFASKTNYGWDYTGAKNTKELHRKLSRYMIRRTKEDCGITLPPKTIIDVPVTRFDQPFADTLQKIEHFQQAVNKRKLPYVVDFLSNLITQGKRPVVFVHHKAVLKELKEKFPHAETIYGGQNVENRQAAVDNFQSLKTNMIICSLQAAATGITLTSSDTAVFAEYLWSPSIQEQAHDRIHRLSQTKPVTIYNLYAEKSIEQQKDMRMYVKKLDMQGIL